MDLRQQAVESIASYMNDQLHDISGDGSMIPWFKEQGDAVMKMIDRAIEQTRQHPLAKTTRVKP